MKITITKKDVLWNYIGTIVTLGGNFLLVPFLLHYLSTDYYGLWNVFMSLGAISALFDFGFNSLFSRNISYSWSGVENLSTENVVKASESATVNYLLLKKVITTCRLIYLIISTSALLVLLTFGSYYVLKVSQSIHDERLVLASWILFAIGIYLDLLYGYFDAFLRGIGEIEADNKARVISKTVQIVVTALLLCFGVGIISTALGTIIYGFVFRGICRRKFYSVKNLTKSLKMAGSVSREDVWDVFKVVWHNAWREGIVSIANYISNQVTTLLCSFYLGLAQAGKYGLAVQCTSAVAQISTSLFSSYMPAMQEAYAHRDTKRIREKISYGMGIYLVLFPLGMMGLLIFIPIINYIKGSQILTINIIIGIGIYQYLLKYRDCYAWYLGGTNRIIYYKSFIVASIVCVVSSIIFVKFLEMGIFGFIFAQIFSQLIHNVWYWPLYVDKELNLNWQKKYTLFKIQLMQTVRDMI